MEWFCLEVGGEVSRAGGRWMASSRLGENEEDGSGSVLGVERRGTRERIRARYVVGAEGARSAVARQLGLDTNQEMLTGVEEVVPSRTNTPVMHCFLDPRLAPGYIAWIVDDGEEAHVGVAGYRKGWDPNTALRAFRAEVEPMAGGRAVERRGGAHTGGRVTRRSADAGGRRSGHGGGVGFTGGTCSRAG